MNIFKRRIHEVAPTVEAPRHGHSAEELTEIMGKLGAESALQSDFMDGEHWPTEGLTDRQIELLVPKLEKSVRNSSQK